jgi:hypothetical protein
MIDAHSIPQHTIKYESKSLVVINPRVIEKLFAKFCQKVVKSSYSSSNFVHLTVIDSASRFVLAEALHRNTSRSSTKALRLVPRGFARHYV